MSVRTHALNETRVYFLIPVSACIFNNWCDWQVWILAFIRYYLDLFCFCFDSLDSSVFAFLFNVTVIKYLEAVVLLMLYLTTFLLIIEQHDMWKRFLTHPLSVFPAVCVNVTDKTNILHLIILIIFETNCHLFWIKFI